MRTELSTLALVIAMSSNGMAGENGAGNTTVVRNGNSVAIITQSGDPAKTVERIEKEPGRTVIYRRSGGNTTVVTQSSGSAEIPLESLPLWMREFFKQ